MWVHIVRNCTVGQHFYSAGSTVRVSRKVAMSLFLARLAFPTLNRVRATTALTVPERR